jgi:23S rRNA pseudouridine1911/1915/1917 synthase
MSTGAEEDFGADNTTDDFVEEVRIIIDKGQEPIRIDKFIASRISKDISRTRIQGAAAAGSILVNGKPVKQNYKVRPLDELLLIIPRSGENGDLSPEDIPLEIVYEDEDVLVINKQAGLVVHPGLGNWTGTLVNALLFHYSTLPGSKDNQRPGLVHRLDKDTTGLMVVAKNEMALSHLAKQFFNRTIRRKYVALAWGSFEETEGTVDVNIGRHTRMRLKMDAFPDGDGGKPAITHYKVLEPLNYVTLIECKLETGRTHQIRVHMKYIGHTLFGDIRYGGNQILKGTVYSKYKQFIDNCFEILPRQALHARELGFIHPVSGKELFFEADLPADFQTILDKWRRYWKNPNAGLNEPE